MRNQKIFLLPFLVLNVNILQAQTKEKVNPPAAIAVESEFGEDPLTNKSGDKTSQSDSNIYDPNMNRYPEKEPLFTKPPAPKDGNSVNVYHPGAAKGLIKIDSEGNYIYKTKTLVKSKASSVRFAQIDPPKVTSAVSSTTTYESMYGTAKTSGVLFDYEWYPFQKFGKLGLQLGTGIFIGKGNGSFKTATSYKGEAVTRAEEVYNMYIIPVSLFAVYRFEFMSSQWIVPFINGGAVYYGMIELRDDGKKRNLVGAGAAGGGGGLLFSLSALDRQKAFTLGEEYGIGNLWLTIEARALQGLSKETDFTSTGVNVGLTVDY